ncbi:hypothetical protein [Wenjunlia tyrosinilytica]|uniref:Uncharacterized protein n=1 Tax=Wenjunlia tyrosinilytica TaxID=1544741 RepID=A0A917ZPW2_9ACTN|nr:hypothetical protein [Wenjunlia tyrosinilytica]GGO87249.1 hypothetical protein GCM10012280_25300 [Wenjunlia tyrosinilytica]
MPVLAFTFEQVMQFRFGVGGATLALLFLAYLKAKNELYQCIAIAVVLLMIF